MSYSIEDNYRREVLGEFHNTRPTYEELSKFIDVRQEILFRKDLEYVIRCSDKCALSEKEKAIYIYFFDQHGFFVIRFVKASDDKRFLCTSYKRIVLGSYESEHLEHLPPPTISPNRTIMMIRVGVLGLITAGAAR